MHEGSGSFSYTDRQEHVNQCELTQSLKVDQQKPRIRHIALLSNHNML